MNNDRESLVTFSDLSQETMVTMAGISEFTEFPLYQYGFNPNLYRDNSFSKIDPEFVTKSDLEPQLKSTQDFISLVANEIGVTNEALYITGAIILVVVLIFIIALITN